MTPYLYYEDLDAAAAWLADTFGLEETVRMNGEDGAPMHIEMTLDEQLVMLGHPGSAFKNPAKRGDRHGCVYVKVNDVDNHHTRAMAAGATVIQPPTDQPYGDRNYAADDPEGHRWYFAAAIEWRPSPV